MRHLISYLEREYSKSRIALVFADKISNKIAFFIEWMLCHFTQEFLVVELRPYNAFDFTGNLHFAPRILYLASWILQQKMLDT